MRSSRIDLAWIARHLPPRITIGLAIIVAVGECGREFRSRTVKVTPWRYYTAGSLSLASAAITSTRTAPPRLRATFAASHDGCFAWLNMSFRGRPSRLLYEVLISCPPNFLLEGSSGDIKASARADKSRESFLLLNLLSLLCQRSCRSRVDQRTIVLIENNAQILTADRSTALGSR